MEHKTTFSACSVCNGSAVVSDAFTKKIPDYGGHHAFDGSRVLPVLLTLRPTFLAPCDRKSFTEHESHQQFPDPETQPENYMKILINSCLVAIATVLLTHAASAAEISVGNDSTQRAAGNAKSRLDDRQGAPAVPRWTLGIGAAYVPRYEGSKEHHLTGLPVIAYRNGRFAAGDGGLSYNLSPASTFEFGPALSFARGRDESDADRLRGLGDIKGGAEAGVFARWRVSSWTAHANLKRGLGSGPEGTQLQFGIGHITRLGGADRLQLGASLDWADDKYTQAYFGVTPAQSAASGLSAYSAAAGIKSYGVNAVWTHTFTPAWFSTVGVHAKRLAGDAANSPVTEQRNVIRASAAIGYRF
jgi:MipA family protein